MSDADSAIHYEVRCDACRVTFPPDARSCFYCGQRLGGTAGPVPPIDAELELGGRPLALRGALTLLWVLFAIAAAVFRFCAER